MIHCRRELDLSGLARCSSSVTTNSAVRVLGSNTGSTTYRLGHSFHFCVSQFPHHKPGLWRASLSGVGRSNETVYITHSVHSKHTSRMAEMAIAKGAGVKGVGIGLVGDGHLRGEGSGKRRPETDFLTASFKHESVSSQGRKLSLLYSS